MRRTRKKAYDEEYLWPIFSLFIRFRDTDKNGIGQCFTCGITRHWKDLDTGHGIPRQHKATKYSEINNHAQCGRCNHFEEGAKDVYRKKVDNLYGPGTWDRLKMISKKPVKFSHFEYDVMTNAYCRDVIELAEAKGIDGTTLPAVKLWLSKQKLTKGIIQKV